MVVFSRVIPLLIAFKIGDKVRFLNAVGYGVVTKIIDKKKFQIENEFGFEEIYNINELVVEGSKEDYNKDNLLFMNSVWGGY